jgi:hypothetical protein
LEEQTVKDKIIRDYVYLPTMHPLFLLIFALIMPDLEIKAYTMALFSAGIMGGLIFFMIRLNSVFIWSLEVGNNTVLETPIINNSI